MLFLRGKGPVGQLLGFWWIFGICLATQTWEPLKEICTHLKRGTRGGKREGKFDTVTGEKIHYERISGDKMNLNLSKTLPFLTVKHHCPVFYPVIHNIFTLLCLPLLLSLFFVNIEALSFNPSITRLPQKGLKTFIAHRSYKGPLDVHCSHL